MNWEAGLPRVSRNDESFLNGKWRWLAYVVVGVCLVVALGEFSLRFPRWKASQFERNLLSICLATTVLLGYVLQWGWRYRRNPKFWLAFSAFASAHTAVFAYLSLYVDRWSAFVLGPIVGAEAVAMAVFINWAIEKRRV